MKLLHSVAVQDQDISADGIQTFDLAVNPLSVILIALRPLNETSTLTNWQSYLTICDALNRVSVLFRGEQIFGMSGRDAAALAYFRHGVVPLQNNHGETDNERRCVILPILMGKFAYDPRSCFPASRRGELTLELDMDIADTGYDDLRISVETVELLDAAPREYEKKVSLAITNAATGDNDLDLPLGNRVRGILLFGTTAFTGATPAPSWGRMQLLLNNQQHSYGSTDFEVAHTLSALMGRQPPSMDAKTHLVDATQADANEETHTGPIDVGAGGWENYCFLELDPTRDDTFSIDTQGASRFHIRSDVETADAVRVIPIEAIKV